MLKFKFLIISNVNKYFGKNSKLMILMNQAQASFYQKVSYIFCYKKQLKHSDMLEVSDQRIYKINRQNQTIDIAISGIPVPVTVSKTSLLNPSVRKKLKINRDNFLAICHQMELEE